MGSGLILLVIVGAWLAVLVPMALRSHDSSTSLSSVDRFNDAMRVLSRREQAGRGSVRSFVLPARPIESAPGVPVAVRRRRVLLSLIGLTAFTFVVGLLGSAWGYLLAAVFAVLAVSYVVHLRKQAVRKQQRAFEDAMRARRRQAVPRDGSAWGAERQPQRVAGIPSRMPARPEPLTAPLPAPAARYEDPHPVGDTWSPTAFPVPTYVTAPVAPPRPPRVLDLTRPGEWSAALEAEDAGLSIFDEDDELDGILDRRRASGDY
ncbi:MAG: hypothetical protein QOE99_3156 [Actinomycetota bacterium]|nr:hypothetical protein [Actinomycetota bacterium]